MTGKAARTTFQRVYCAFSFAAFLLAIALWVIGFHRIDIIELSPLQGGAGNYAGYIEFEIWSRTPRPRMSYWYRHSAYNADSVYELAKQSGYCHALPNPFGVIGVVWFVNDPWMRRHHVAGNIRGVAVPHAILAVIFLAYPVRFAWKWRTERRSRRIGLCTACGYDLRGTPTRCPECGKVVA